LQVPFYVLGIVLILFFIFLPILAIQKDIIWLFSPFQIIF
jgi:hypothetical protein